MVVVDPLSLDRMLGSHPEVASTGELCNLLGDWDRRLCSCGMSYAKCKFWKDLGLDRVAMLEMEDIMRKEEKASSVPRIPWGMVSEADRAIYRESQSRLFDYVMGHSAFGLADEIISESMASRHPPVGVKVER